MAPAPGLIFAADGATVVAGAFNAAWLVDHWLGLRHRGRRLAALTLALLNAGVAVQAAFAQSMFVAHVFGAGVEPYFEPALWLASRAALLAGTLLLSLLILRRAAR